MKIKSTMLAILASAVCLPFVFSAQAQQEDTRPQRHKRTEYQKYVAVNYILLDVIVTDRDGNYVRNLTKDDFEVFENGRRVQLDSLDEYQMIDLGLKEGDPLTPAPPSVDMNQPPRNIIILFDLFYSSTYGIKRAVETAEEFIADSIEPGDNLMVLSYYKGLKTIQPFTSDKFKAIKSMRELGLATDLLNARSEPLSGQDLAEYSSLLADRPFEGEEGEGSFQADLEEFNARNNARNYLLSLSTLAKAMRYQPGRKTLILLSEGVNFDLIDPTNMNLEKYGPGGRLVRSADRPAVGVSLFSEYEKMLEDLNASKISLYSINVGGLSAPGDAGKRLAEVDRITNQPDFKSDMDNRKNRQDFLSSLSKETGGRSYFNANNILTLLNQIDVDISNYYLLGYRTDVNPKRSEYRKISVKSTRPGLRIVHRKGFFTPRPFKTLDKNEREMQLTEGFLSRSAINELGASVKYEYVRPSTDKLNTLVCLEVPTEHLALDGGRLELEVLVSNLNDEGRVFSSVHKLYSRDNAEQTAFDGRNLRIMESLDSDKGINRIRVALRDNNTGKRTYFYENYRFLPEEGDESLLLSQPFFFDPNDMRRAVDEFGLKVEQLENYNENPAGGYDFLTHPTQGALFPLLGPVYKSGDTVSFLVVLRNVKSEITSDSMPKFEFAISRVTNEESAREYYRVNPAHQQIFRLRAEGLVLLADFQISGIEPGYYDLFAFVTDNQTKQRAASVGRLKLEE
jgi:VWFA-related protein